MNKAAKAILCLILFFGTPFYLQAARHYVIDNLNAYIHSGPGTNYRIIGAVKAGDAVNITSQQAEKGYLKIKTKNRTGWIDEKLLSKQPGIAFQLEKTQKMLVKAQLDSKTMHKTILDKNAGLETEIQNKNDEIEKLKIQNSNASTRLADAQEQATLLQGKLDNLDESTKMHWLSYGGGWALLWLLLGIIIPRISWKKKQQDRWM